MENLQSLVQEISSRIRMLNEKINSELLSRQKNTQAKPISCNELGICEEEPDLLSPNTSVQLSLVNTLERNLDKLLGLIKAGMSDELEALRSEVTVLKGVNEVS